VGVSTPRRPPVPYRPPQTDRLEPTLSPAAVLPSGSTRGPCRAPHCRLRPLTAARASTPRRPPALTPRTICPSPYQGEARWGSPLRDSPRPHTGHLKTDRFRPISPPPRRCPRARPEGHAEHPIAGSARRQRPAHPPLGDHQSLPRAQSVPPPTRGRLGGGLHSATALAHTGHLKPTRLRPISPPPRRCPWTRPEGLPPRGTCQYWAPHRPSKLAPRSIEGCGRNPPPPQKKQKSRRIAATAPALESAHSLEA